MRPSTIAGHGSAGAARAPTPYPGGTRDWRGVNRWRWIMDNIVDLINCAIRYAKNFFNSCNNALRKVPRGSVCFGIKDSTFIIVYKYHICKSTTNVYTYFVTHFSLSFSNEFGVSFTVLSPVLPNLQLYHQVQVRSISLWWEHLSPYPSP